jgi:hypothetical protein
VENLKTLSKFYPVNVYNNDEKSQIFDLYKHQFIEKKNMIKQIEEK